MLDRARERAIESDLRNIDLRVMDARRLSFADASFDHVLAPYVISVVPEPDRVMAEIARVVRPGGTVMVVNHFGSRQMPLSWIERALTPLSQWIGFRLDLPIETVTAAPGLEVVRVDRVNLLGLWRLVELRRPS
jgi:phosphatidylethanolamine/phosphatidyl-N-methylethanolamine N-methyltransferase